MTETATPPYRCPTPCDEDCEINGWGCHEAHDVPTHREHDPGACEAQMLAGNLRWLLGRGWEAAIGATDPADVPEPFYVMLRAGRGKRTLYGVSPGDALVKAVEWARQDDRETAAPAGNACRGFQWIGQSFATCDGCGKPAWEHEGMLRLREGAKLSSISDDSHWEVVPWKPGEAEAIKRKWA